MLLELKLPSFNTVLRNARVLILLTIVLCMHLIVVLGFLKVYSCSFFVCGTSWSDNKLNRLNMNH